MPCRFGDQAAAGMESGMARIDEVARTDALEWPARAGFIGYGVVHLIVAWMALEISWGRPPEEGGHFGAFQVLAGQRYGRWLLIAAVRRCGSSSTASSPGRR
jgi:hypothetical protein